jgi:hypothetical protein
MIKRTCPQCGAEWFSAVSQDDWTCDTCGAQLGAELNDKERGKEMDFEQMLKDILGGTKGKGGNQSVCDITVSITTDGGKSDIKNEDFETVFFIGIPKGAMTGIGGSVAQVVVGKYDLQRTELIVQAIDASKSRHMQFKMIDMMKRLVDKEKG